MTQPRGPSPSDTQVLRAKGYKVKKHFRRWARTAVNIPAKVEILLSRGSVYTSGTAIIRDISLRGARLGKFVLKKQSFPAQPFQIRLFFHSEKYRHVGAMAKPVRFGAEKAFELVVLFDDLWARTDEAAVRNKKTKRKVLKRK